MKISRTIAIALAAAGIAAPAAAQYHQVVANDLGKCGGSGPAVKVNISGISQPKGTLRVQLYAATASDWLVKGHWINRIEVPARSATAIVCVPAPHSGSYAIAVRHDVNDNHETDLREDGGGMSNNPPISILNLGKPSYKQTAFTLGDEVKAISIRMRYF